MATEIDQRSLNQPVELVVRGDRMDVAGWVAGTELMLAGEKKPGEALIGRGRKVAHQVSDALTREDNLELLRRDAEKAIEDGEDIPFRGVDALYRPFDPKHPDDDLDIEGLPSLADVDAYLVIAVDGDGFYGAGHPEQLDPLTGMALASFLRTYAREIEQELGPPALEDGDAA